MATVAVVVAVTLDMHAATHLVFIGHLSFLDCCFGSAAGAQSGVCIRLVLRLSGAARELGARIPTHSCTLRQQSCPTHPRHYVSDYTARVGFQSVGVVAAAATVVLLPWGRRRNSRSRMSPLRAVIFDVDGTLLNTETAAKQAARQVLRELGGNELLLQRHAEAEKQVWSWLKLKDTPCLNI